MTTNTDRKIIIAILFAGVIAMAFLAVTMSRRPTLTPVKVMEPRHKPDWVILSVHADPNITVSVSTQPGVRLETPYMAPDGLYLLVKEKRNVFLPALLAGLGAMGILYEASKLSDGGRTALDLEE